MTDLDAEAISPELREEKQFTLFVTAHRKGVTVAFYRPAMSPPGQFPIPVQVIEDFFAFS
jgi:hypothetical protein